MTAQPDLPHKVSQIRHDLDDLYELVSKVERNQAQTEIILQHHSNRLDELQQTLDVHGGRLDRIEGSQRRMQESLQRLEGNQQGLEGNQQRLDDNQNRLEGNQQRLEGNQQRLEDNQNRQFEHLSGQIAEILSLLRSQSGADDSAPESKQ